MEVVGNFEASPHWYPMHHGRLSFDTIIGLNQYVTRLMYLGYVNTWITHQRSGVHCGWKGCHAIEKPVMVCTFSMNMIRWNLKNSTIAPSQTRMIFDASSVWRIPKATADKKNQVVYFESCTKAVWWNIKWMDYTPLARMQIWKSEFASPGLVRVSCYQSYAFRITSRQ